jgi:hypothetical protein
MPVGAAQPAAGGAAARTAGKRPSAGCVRGLLRASSRFSPPGGRIPPGRRRRWPGIGGLFNLKLLLWNRDKFARKSQLASSLPFSLY